MWRNPARFLAISEDARAGYRKWPDNPESVKRSQQSALRARDDGLRRVRKITWRIGPFAGARFAHLSPSLPHLPSSPASGSGTGSGTSSGQSSSSSQGSSSQGSSVTGISSSSGVSPAGGGQVTSGGS